MEKRTRRSRHTFVWTDELVLEFAKISMKGPYGSYKGCKSTEQKLIRFKEVEHNKNLVWVKENKDFLSIARIEKDIGMPETTLLKAVNGIQHFPKKWEADLDDFVRKFRKKY
tara:strand:+ start:5484 stop:5819 length:336 start_codon:yes stop_codon:yes gene_type:complete